ncbi:unnamed protein product, partial [Didymodactylos carnosus]
MIASLIPLNFSAYPNYALNCTSGCTTVVGYSSIPLANYCTDFSVPLDLTVGRQTDTVNVSLSSDFTVAFQSSAWQPLAVGSGLHWSISCTIDNLQRPDGKINTSPISTMSSPLNIPAGITQYITIPTADSDNDDVRCRFANGTVECADVCYPNSVPNGTLLLSNCTLIITGTVVNAVYAIAIQVEDFWNTSSTTPFSSIPTQFLVKVYSPPACTMRPLIYPGVQLDACIGIQVGQTFQMQLIAENLCGNNTTISDIGTVSFFRVSKSSLIQNSTNIWSITITYIPLNTDVGSQTLPYVQLPLPARQVQWQHFK